MALYIEYNELHAPRNVTREWHVYEPINVHIDSVKLVQADGDELSYVLARFMNLPQVIHGARVQQWFGETAKFIVANLK